MKISKRNRVIYIAGLLLSLALLVVYFINPSNPWCIMFCSIGASGIGAVILAWLIEDSNNRKVESEKNRTRESITSPIIRDLTQIICMESLIVEQESEIFKQSIQGKTLTEIVEALENHYRSEITKNPTETLKDSYAFDEKNQEIFEKRVRVLKMLGGLLNYAVDDMYFNRSYNISYDLFSDNEIEHLKMLQINLTKVKNSECYTEYILNYLEFIAWIDCYNETKSFFKVFNSIRKSENDFFDEKGTKILLGYRSWIKNNEIPLHS